ncbi:MAG: hypothetical protein KJ737_03455 [Proteobacteria bacterium]|nr:hypothetical protein [Pseudomonadota bacterium]
MLKKLYIGLMIILFLPATSMAVSLTDYVIPESFSKDLYLNGAFNFSDGNQPRSSYNGYTSANFNTRYSSIPRVWSLKADGLYEIIRGRGSRR